MLMPLPLVFAEALWIDLNIADQEIKGSFCTF